MIMLTGFVLFFSGLFLGIIWAEPHTIHISLTEKVAAGLMLLGIVTMAASGVIAIWTHLP